MNIKNIWNHQPETPELSFSWDGSETSHWFAPSNNLEPKTKQLPTIQIPARPLIIRGVLGVSGCSSPKDTALLGLLPANGRSCWGKEKPLLFGCPRVYGSFGKRFGIFQWVITYSPKYTPFISRWNNPLIRSPLILTSNILVHLLKRTGLEAKNDGFFQVSFRVRMIFYEILWSLTCETKAMDFFWFL